MSVPQSWVRYLKSLGRKSSPDTALDRFCARYRLATELETARIDDAKAARPENFLSALRVSQSLATLDALRTATHLNSDKLYAPRLAEDYRKAALAPFRELLESADVKPRIARRLHALTHDASASNVIPIAEAVRAVTFQGDFSPYSSPAVRSHRARSFLDTLSLTLLSAADTEFELYLDRHAIGPWNLDLVPRCPSCSATIGAKHGSGCSIGRCKYHGEPRDQCFGSGRHGSTTYWGVYPGTIEAVKRGWFAQSKKIVRPDINRVMAELTWDPTTERFI